MSEEPSAQGSEEQLLYARILAAGMYTGLVLLLVTFVLYVTGIVEPAVPITELPNYWTMGVDEYLETINSEYLRRDYSLTGWWWLSALGKGDFLNLVGIVVLASITIVCYVGIIPTLLRKRDYVYAAIACVEVIVLVFVASGVLVSGH